MVFSVFAVAPLIPSLKLAVEAQAVTAYLLVVAVIMQEGMLLHELAVKAVNRRRSRISGNGSCPQGAVPLPARMPVLYSGHKRAESHTLSGMIDECRVEASDEAAQRPRGDPPAIAPGGRVTAAMLVS